MPRRRKADVEWMEDVRWYWTCHARGHERFEALIPFVERAGFPLVAQALETVADWHGDYGGSDYVVELGRLVDVLLAARR